MKVVYFKFLVVLAYVWTVNTEPCTLLNSEGYYWRDFYGDIPQDALPGGKDVNGKPMYIAQVLYEAYLIPGKIYQNNPHAYFEWAWRELTAEKFVKILCAKTPESFEWIPRNSSDNMELLTGRHLVQGGYESASASTYIGRIYINNETTIGKVLVAKYSPYDAHILVTTNGLTESHTSFEVLAFNNNNNINSNNINTDNATRST